MAESVEELTFNYTNEEGQLVRKQLDKEVLSKGAWATIMYLYQDLDRRNNTYRVPKVSIVRYRKSNGVYRKQSSFNISSERQGRHIVSVLEDWYEGDKAKAQEKPVEQQVAQEKPAEQPVAQEKPAELNVAPETPSQVSENMTPASTQPSFTPSTE